MRALFLIPGDGVNQIQALPAVAATAEALGFAIQVGCPPEQASIWKLLPVVEKVLPFSYATANLADWANLLGSVREPDFQVAVNLAPSRQMDLLLSMSHIPTRVAREGFSATEIVVPPTDGWPAQALAAHLRPLGVTLAAAKFRLPLSPGALAEASAVLPAGEGPMLLLCPGEAPLDWPAERWRELPERIRSSLAALRSQRLAPATAAGAAKRAAAVAVADVVLSSDPISTELALLCGTPVVALGREPSTLPERAGVRGVVGPGGSLATLGLEEVLQALGLA
jgi:ADP-heptose:LPS heptosyltransferase